jgi:cell division septal protein FtsQ
MDKEQSKQLKLNSRDGEDEVKGKKEKKEKEAKANKWMVFLILVITVIISLIFYFSGRKKEPILDTQFGGQKVYQF